jgi:hypothetical protein
MHEHAYTVQSLGDGRWEALVTLAGRVAARFYADSLPEVSRRAQLYLNNRNYRRDRQWQYSK